jgi:hypothetical protein
LLKTAASKFYGTIALELSGISVNKMVFDRILQASFGDLNLRNICIFFHFQILRLLISMKEDCKYNKKCGGRKIGDLHNVY